MGQCVVVVPMISCRRRNADVPGRALKRFTRRTVISRDLLQIVWNCSRWFWRLEAQGRAIFTGTPESLNFSVRTPWRLPVLAKFACGTSDNLVTTVILGPILTERYVPRTVSDLAERSEDALSAERMPVKDSSP